jgi:hypothetical protein
VKQEGQNFMTMNDVINTLALLGILPAIQIAAVGVVAIFLYRYFTDKS